MNAMNIELPNNIMLSLDETASGDIELGLSKRGSVPSQSIFGNLPGKWHQEIKCTIPFNRRELLIRFLDNRPTS